MTIQRTIAILAATAALSVLGATALAQTAQPAATAAGGPVRGDSEPAPNRNAARFTQADGEALYMNVCAACHMPDGTGASGAGIYPSLAGNRKLAAKAYPAYVVAKGLNGMPAVGEMMSDEQVAQVVNYVRTHFGNSYQDAMLPGEVQPLR